MINAIKWDITFTCNLRCRHCYISEEQRRMKELTTQESFRALDKFSEEGVEKIYFLGGEPLFRPDFFEILEYTNQLGINSVIVTNGTLFSQRDLERLLNFNILKMNFSIDGGISSTHDWNRGKGTFETTVNTVKQLCDLKQQHSSAMDVSLNFVITKKNSAEIEKVIELADYLNVEAVIPLGFGDIGDAKFKKDLLEPSPSDLIDALERASKKTVSINRKRSSHGLRPLKLSAHMYTRKVITYLNNKYGVGIPLIDSVCGAGMTSLYIAPDGSVAPCDGAYFLSDILEKSIGKYTLPKIQDHELDEIIESSFFTKAILLFHNPYILNSAIPCNTCEYRKSCSVCALQTLKYPEVDRCIEINRRLKEELQCM